jgi:hypothetical protein
MGKMAHANRVKNTHMKLIVTQPLKKSFEKMYRVKNKGNGMIKLIRRVRTVAAM